MARNAISESVRESVLKEYDYKYSEKVDELLDFVGHLRMGEFYSKRLKKLLKRSRAYKYEKK